MNFRWVLGCNVLCVSVTNVTDCSKTNLKLYFCSYNIYFDQFTIENRRNWSNIENMNFRWVLGCNVLCVSVTNVTDCSKTNLKLFFCSYNIYFDQFAIENRRNWSNIENMNSRWVLGCYALQCYKCNKLFQNYHLIVKLTLSAFDCRVKHRNRKKIMISRHF